MKKFTEQLHKAAHKKHSLTASERREMRERLVAYTEYYPLPQQTAAKNASAYIASQPYALVRFNTFYTRFAAGVFAFLVVIGVPLSAERSVPGDTLYPVKVRFNEEIRSTLTLNQYQKVAWETSRIERRISEARLLASEGKLTDEVEAEVVEAVRVHTEAAQDGLAELRVADAEEAVIAEITFESALEVQSAVLAETPAEEGTASTTEGTSVVAIAEAVVEAAASVAAAKSTTTPSYDRLLGQVELETTRAFSLLESISPVASSEESTDIDRRLSDIKRKVETAAVIHGEGDMVAATDLLVEALSDTQKLITFMTDIEVHDSVTVEELVPVALTELERVEAITGSLENIANTKNIVATRVARLTEADFIEKVTAGLAEVAAHVGTAEAAIEVGDTDGAESAAAVAYELVTDLDIATTVAAADVTQESEEVSTSTEPVAVTEDASTSTPAETEVVPESETTTGNAASSTSESLSEG